jgi:hypothetical protein
MKVNLVRRGFTLGVACFLTIVTCGQAGVQSQNNSLYQVQDGNGRQMPLTMQQGSLGVFQGSRSPSLSSPRHHPSSRG